MPFSRPSAAIRAARPASSPASTEAAASRSASTAPICSRTSSTRRSSRPPSPPPACPQARLDPAHPPADLAPQPRRRRPPVAGDQLREPLVAVAADRLLALDGLLGAQSLDGLITNDKFCLTRAGRLRLAWSRVQVRGRAPDGAYPRGEVTHRGGGHAPAALLARPAHRRDGADRSAALGPALSAPPAVGDDGPGRAGGIPGGGQPAGDVPCA